MAVDIHADEQSTGELIGYLVDFVYKIPEGETITTATVTHVPPPDGDGEPSVLVAEIDESAVSFEFGPPLSLGLHYLRVLAEFSNGQSAEARLWVPVNW